MRDLAVASLDVLWMYFYFDGQLKSEWHESHALGRGFHRLGCKVGCSDRVHLERRDSCNLVWPILRVQVVCEGVEESRVESG